MAIKVQLYGQLKQITGGSEIFIEASDTDGLIREMNIRFPSIENLNYLVAVDRNIVQENTIIRADQELAMLPPYSGG